MFSLYTDVVLFFFLFFSNLRWRSINPLWFMFYRSRLTDFKEKMGGGGSVNRLAKLVKLTQVIE